MKATASHGGSLGVGATNSSRSAVWATRCQPDRGNGNAGAGSVSRNSRKAAAAASGASSSPGPSSAAGGKRLSSMPQVSSGDAITAGSMVGSGPVSAPSVELGSLAGSDACAATLGDGLTAASPQPATAPPRMHAISRTSRAERVRTPVIPGAYAPAATGPLSRAWNSALVGSSGLPRRDMPRRIQASGIGNAHWNARKSITPAVITDESAPPV